MTNKFLNKQAVGRKNWRKNQFLRLLPVKAKSKSCGQTWQTQFPCFTAAFLEAAHAQLVRKMNVVILRKRA